MNHKSKEIKQPNKKELKIKRLDNLIKKNKEEGAKLSPMDALKQNMKNKQYEKIKATIQKEK